MYTFEISVKEEKICNSILNLLSQYEGFEEKHGIILYKNGNLYENNKEIEGEFEANEEKIPIKIENEEKTIKKTEEKTIEDKVPDMLLAENITISKEKIYQIFFIFGDIQDIKFQKNQVIFNIKFPLFEFI